MNTIKASDLINLFDSWKQLFAEQREFLISLDGKVGDSDLGITMSKAFAAAAEATAEEGEAAGIAKLLRLAGATMARVAPSTMGTLTATGFLRASKACEGVDAIGTAEMAAFWRAYRDGVAERGKAKVGDKTLLDVLDPIAVTLEAQAAAGASCPTHWLLQPRLPKTRWKQPSLWLPSMARLQPSRKRPLVFKTLAPLSAPS